MAVVMPHPPILRSLNNAVEKLRAAGHEVIEFSPLEHKRAWDIAVSGCYNGMVAVSLLTDERVAPPVLRYRRERDQGEHCCFRGALVSGGRKVT